MFLQDTPPDTSAYMIAGYTIFYLIALIYVVSLFARGRNLALDLTTLEKMEADAKVSAKPVTTLKPKATKPGTGRPRQAVKKVKAKK